MHLSGLKDMLSVITTMDSIKNCQILPTYFADMLYLNNGDPAVWKFFPEETLVYKRTPYPLHQLVGIMHTNKKTRNWKLAEGWKEYLVTLTQERDSF